MTETEPEPLPLQANAPTRLSVVMIETAVVISVAVVPALCGALMGRPQGLGPYTIRFSAAQLIPRSISVISVLLYLIWRSDRPWLDFGLTRLRFLPDVIGGLGVTALFYVAYYGVFYGLYYALGRMRTTA